MKYIYVFLSVLFWSLGLCSIRGYASPVLYISNQANFEKPLVYVAGYGVPGDYSTYFDFGYDGYSRGQVTVGDLTYDMFPLPDEAVGVTASVQYSDDWRYNKPEFEMTFEDKDYYLLANASGLKEVVPGGVNEYVLLYLENLTTIDADKNSLKVYAVADDGSELFGPYPGASYATTRMVDKKSFYLYDMPKGDKSYRFTFSNEDYGFKLESDFIHIPDNHAFVTITDNSCEALGNLLSAETTVDKLSYNLDKGLRTAQVLGLEDPTEELSSLVIPATIMVEDIEYKVTSIKAGAFHGLRNVSGPLTLGENLIRIGDNAFNGCQNLTGDLTIGDRVVSIGESAFSACNGMDGNLSIGKNVEKIGANAFLMCSRLKGEITLPEPLKSIGDAAFSGCSNLEGVKFGTNLTSIGSQAFMSDYNLAGDLELPQSIESIGESAFFGCSGLNGNLILPAGLTDIPQNLFFQCSGLTGSLDLPAGITAIGDGAFLGCANLKGSLSIPSEVTVIGKNAFSGCVSFNGSLSLGDKITIIDDGAFQNCSKFFGWLTLPSSLSVIGNYAFNGCEKLSGPLSIPENVTKIGSYAFALCEGFKGKLTIGENVAVIGEQAFVGCSNLTGKLIIPQGVTEIGFRTFGWCSGLTSLELPASVSAIANVAFYGCWNLESIICKGETAPVIVSPDKAFDSESYTKATLYVPASAIESYKTAYEWSSFENIVADQSGIDSVGYSADENNAEYYNLQGIRILSPQKGQIVIERRAGSSRKIIF